MIKKKQCMIIQLKLTFKTFEQKNQDVDYCLHFTHRDKHIKDVDRKHDDVMHIPSLTTQEGS